jgi:hypothetical protein
LALNLVAPPDRHARYAFALHLDQRVVIVDRQWSDADFPFKFRQVDFRHGGSSSRVSGS